MTPVPDVRRGRPRKDETEKLQTVSACLPPDVHRMLRRIADRRGLNVSEVVRRILIGRLHDGPAQARI